LSTGSPTFQCWMRPLYHGICKVRIMKFFSFKYFIFYLWILLLTSFDSEVFCLFLNLCYIWFICLCWKFRWLESDSQLVNLVFKNISTVLLITRCLNCLALFKYTLLCLTILGKVIGVLTGFASLALSGSSFTWWDHVLPDVSGANHCNRLSLLEFRFK
jgi:hypothetical protein